MTVASANALPMLQLTNRLRVIAGEIGLSSTSQRKRLTHDVGIDTRTDTQLLPPPQLSYDGVAQWFCSSLRHTLIFSCARPNY